MRDTTGRGVRNALRLPDVGGVGPAKNAALFPQLFLRLSRACLGKMIIVSIIVAPKRRPCAPGPVGLEVCGVSRDKVLMADQAASFVPPACAEARVHVERQDVFCVAVVHCGVIQPQPERGVASLVEPCVNGSSF
jgi:hypothetical protein